MGPTNLGMCPSMQFHRFDLHSGGERSYQFFGGEEGRSDILHYPEFLIKREREFDRTAKWGLFPDSAGDRCQSCEGRTRRSSTTIVLLVSRQ